MQDYETIKRRATEVKMAKQMFLLALKKGNKEKTKQYLDEMYLKARDIITDNPKSIAAAIIYSNASQAAFEYHEKNSSPLFTAAFANFVFRRLKKNLCGFPDSEEAQALLLGAAIQLISAVQKVKEHYEFLFLMKRYKISPDGEYEEEDKEIKDEDEGNEDEGNEDEDKEIEDEDEGNEDEGNEDEDKEIEDEDELFFNKMLNGMVQAALAIGCSYLGKIQDINPEHPIIAMAEGVISETIFDFDEEIGNFSIEQCGDRITELLELLTK